jgi:hypothetical protein
VQARLVPQRLSDFTQELLPVLPPRARFDEEFLGLVYRRKDDAGVPFGATPDEFRDADASQAGGRFTG